MTTQPDEPETAEGWYAMLDLQIAATREIVLRARPDASDDLETIRNGALAAMISFSPEQIAMCFATFLVREARRG